MRSFTAFCKKEFLESLRTYKLIIMLAAFTLFGLMSPLTAKLLPDILNGTDMGGMVIQIPEPSALDSWAQFFKNISQMGVLVLVIVFCGIMAGEFSKGTLINMLTKGLRRRFVILSKFCVATLIWTASYALSVIVTYAYTVYFWGNIALPHAFLAFISPLIYGLLLIALMILGGVWFKNFYGSLLLPVCAAIIFSLLSISPKLQRFNPISLSGDTLNLLIGQKTPSDYFFALLICLGLIVMSLICAIASFDKKPL